MDKDCKHDYENPIKLGRANYICRKCKKNITIDLVYLMEEGLEINN